MPVRRVVTGHTAEGKSVFISDGPTPRIATARAAPGTVIEALWATDNGMTAVPGSDDPTPNMITLVPGHGGTRFVVTVFPPESTALPPLPNDVDPAELVEELAARIPGLAQAMEPDHPGMHTTDTVDYVIVISGDLWLELDDGAMTQLRPGDVVVQTGTRHAWRNRGATPAVIYGVLVGAPRD